MKRFLMATTLAATAALAASLPAWAADLDIPIGVETRTPVEYGSGWYLRGDIGYAVHSGSSGTYYSTAFGNDTDYADESLSAGPSYSIGMGYVFNDMLRADITVEHSTGIEWEGSSKAASCGDGVAPDGECMFDAEAEMKRTSIMANGYVSMGDFGGIKPYVGGGIGVTHVAWSNYDFEQYCLVDPGEDCAFGVHSGGAGRERLDGPAGSVTTNAGLALTYALAAGVDFRLDKNWTVDLGYKWTHISDHIMLKEDVDGAGTPGGDSAFNGINLHEVKVGLRYEVW